MSQPTKSFHNVNTLRNFFLSAITLVLPSRTPPPPRPRRSIKLALMSRPPTSANQHRLFATPQSLSDWLKPRLPSTSFDSWGVKPGTKNVHNLWLELTEGETYLADATPPVRTVNVVSVRVIGKENRVLVESHQELSDGSVRYRSRPLSEKMKPDETHEEAAVRAVKEELGSLVNGVVLRIVPGSHRSKVEEKISVSYPGLPARYVLHYVDGYVDGLPEGEFYTEEEDEYGGNSERTTVADKAVSVKKHYWKWVSSDSVQS